MNRYHITDRTKLGSASELLDVIARNDRAGVDMIQIREKDLSPRALAELVGAALQRVRRAKILVNTRVDVALACGAHGAHLPAGSPPPSAWRGITPPGFLFGVSCHGVSELLAAESGGADFAVYGPVFQPLSKADPRALLGLDGLREGVRATRLPVYALGGITAGNALACWGAGAAGVAGITLFQGM